MTFSTRAAYERLHPFFHDRIYQDEPLAHHNSLDIGGPADIWLVLEQKSELINLVKLCAQEHWPLLLVGNGSNILFADEGVRGIVARMAIHEYTLSPRDDGTALLVVAAGTNWASIAHNLATQGWSGLEFGVGIPGTLGAGLVSNAGAHKRELSEALEWITILDARGCNTEHDAVSEPLLRRYTKDQLDLSYRSSRFRKEHESRITENSEIIIMPRMMIEPAEMVLELAFLLHHENPKTLEHTLAGYRQERKQEEPHVQHSGLIFIDPPGARASDLIKQVDLAGEGIGHAYISEYNANYIVNGGGACAKDVKNLISMAHSRVQERLHINLQLNLELH